jgi:hypothetical protein
MGGVTEWHQAVLCRRQEALQEVHRLCGLAALRAQLAEPPQAFHVLGIKLEDGREVARAASAIALLAQA